MVTREKGLILGAAIGDCVHVAGVLGFLRLAEQQGYDTIFLGPAVRIKQLVGAIIESEPDIVAVGYRLTPQTGELILKELSGALREAGINTRLVFGGTTPVAAVARELAIFEKVFDGDSSPEEVVAYLQGRTQTTNKQKYASCLRERIRDKHPYPIIRHHFGLPSVDQTIAGISQIADAKVLDVISIGPDQAAQECFFRPEQLKIRSSGAGGVPIRSRDHLRALYQAARQGNCPLLRCYSGTNDVLAWAELLSEEINNAWCAVPLSWYNVLDGRGPRSLIESMTDAQQLMQWHGRRKIPVECNEAHHWSLRDAHDTIAVVMAYLAAYNCKQMGVREYIAQYMLSTPPALTPAMDLGKMLAKKELIDSLQDENFQVYTQVRAGLVSFPADLHKAKGQLGYATFLGMALKPDIVHVVSFSEADHAATAQDVVESCLIAQRIIENTLHGLELTADPHVQQRKRHLLGEARILLDAIKTLGKGIEDPLCDVQVLSQAVEVGLVDAPQLKNRPPAQGLLATSIVSGGCDAIDPKTRKVIGEKERISMLGH